MDRLTYINSGNADYIDSLYAAYQQDAGSIEFGWQKFFEGFDFGISLESPGDTSEDPTTTTALQKEINVLNLINDYRTRGHLFAKTNPVRRRRTFFPGKQLENFGLSADDLDTAFCAGAELGLGKAKLSEIISLLEQTYCQAIGSEYKYISEPEKLNWLQQRIESTRNTPKFGITKKKQILSKLNQAVVFETFLATKFLGQKRFSLEGAESVIPALDQIIESGVALGIAEFIIGMGHRGRLNVLANVMDKPYKEIFSEFQGKTEERTGIVSGDVKYHLGYSHDVTTNLGNQVHLSLCPNPSHLETVDAVVQGMVRAKTEFKYEGNFSSIAPIILHGDGSLAGQGVVYEVIQMEKLEGYHTGGTIHLVINNQVGFTTDFKDARSSTYCTDLAKVVQAPVFHVNGDDAEAVAHAVQIATEYRQQFHSDVFIDMVCYRKYGHNESDEPRFTQPLLYKAIETHLNPKEIYTQKLISEGSIDKQYALDIEKELRTRLQVILEEAKLEDSIQSQRPMFMGAWKGLRRPNSVDFNRPVDTRVPGKTLKEIARRMSSLPDAGNFMKKIAKLFEDRKVLIEQEKPLDWAMGELLAYGTLLHEAYPVRLSGEDVKRGTFSHRHAVAVEADSGNEYLPLNNIEAPARFSIYNSLLSEYGVLGFEYGYAMASPDALVLWEAQFGDFLNTAQVVVDQYIASAETKWQRGNGLVLLLPHGYEGEGPEHSSARIERFLELCANENIQVVNASTPANFFHVLRRQLHRDFRVPLIIFTPKSLLRHPLCVSPLKDFSEGGFEELIDDAGNRPEEIKKVLLCSGKIYYELLQKKQEQDRSDIAIVRLEQLYPLPVTAITEIKQKYTAATSFIWVQEEPENMGAWPYLCRKFFNSDIPLRVIARPESSSTATGYKKVHSQEQLDLIERAMAQ